MSNKTNFTCNTQCLFSIICNIVFFIIIVIENNYNTVNNNIILTYSLYNISVDDINRNLHFNFV